MLRFASSIILLVSMVLVFLAGCGGSRSSPALPDYGSEEGRKIAEFVSYFNDYKADPVKFKKAFAGGTPASWKEYEPFRYEVKVGSPKVEGTTATAAVEIYKESGSEVVATREWTFAKVGDGWKLTSAPLR